MDFGLKLSDASLDGILLREGLEGSAEFSAANIRSVDIAMVKSIPMLLLSPQSVSEGGYSLSRAQRDSIETYYSFMCKKYGIKTTVSMNPIMIDGTGMCGGCRLTVGGQVKFACVDGPDFDGHQVDFDEAMHRGGMYRDFEAHAREAACNLLKKEVE